jgi:hypothetical protein
MAEACTIVKVLGEGQVHGGRLLRVHEAANLLWQPGHEFPSHSPHRVVPPPCQQRRLDAFLLAPLHFRRPQLLSVPGLALLRLFSPPLGSLLSLILERSRGAIQNLGGMNHENGGKHDRNGSIVYEIERAKNDEVTKGGQASFSAFVTLYY